jgi:hypothetical protein
MVAFSGASRAFGLILMVATLAAGCAPASGGRGPTDAGPAQPAKPKVLTLGATTEPSDLGSFTATSGIRGSGNATMIAHAGLSVLDEREAKIPELATDIPAVERGPGRSTPTARWKQPGSCART